MDATSPLPTRRPALLAGAPVTKNWTRINDQEDDLQELIATVAQLRRDHTAPDPQRITFGHFPFRIYHLPDYMRTAPKPMNDWLKFCVRGARVFVNWAEII